MEEDLKILEDFIKYFEAEAISRKYRRNISITVGEDDIEAIENLLKGYKELEKGLNNAVSEQTKLTRENTKLRKENHELENADLTIVYMNGFYDGEKKWKDKIKEKTRYYQELYKKDNSPNEFLISQDCLSKLSFAQELLQEGDK